MGLLELSKRAEQKGLRWFGHVERMEEGRTVKRITGSRARGVRKVGRPRMTWEEGIRNSLKERGMEEEQGRIIARDRREWRRLVNA